MSNLIKFSVILTTYNSEKTVEKVIASILNQKGIGSLFTMEILVIDDCSTDNIRALLQNFPIRFFSTLQNTGGPNQGRNIGLDNVTGDYICIVDHDDYWKEHRLVSILPYLDKVPIITSGYDLQHIGFDKKIVRGNHSDKGYLYFEKNTTFLKRLQRCLDGQCAYMGSLVYHKSLKNIRFGDHSNMIDFDWALELFHQRDSIEVCDSLYIRNVEGNNLSLSAVYRTEDFYYSLMIIEKYQLNYPKEVKKSYFKIHGSRARFYYYTGNMKKARFYFLRSKISFKLLLYFLTTFIGHRWVKKRFPMFG